VPPYDVVDEITYHRLLKPGVRTYPRVPLFDYVNECAAGVVQKAKELRAGIVHASSLYDVGMAGLVAARELGLPFIYEMRGLKQLLEISRDPSFEGSDRFRMLEMLEVQVAKQADMVFVITEALKREMISKGVAADRVIVIANGVHTSRFQKRDRDRELSNALGLDGKTVIGYAGGLVHYEGIELLLDAVAELSKKRDDIHLLIVGDGAHERAVRAHADSLPLDGVVTFTGRVRHDEVERYLSLIDIAPLPRLPLRVCELISPIKPFEAMAMGKVVVVSDVAALTEIVQDGETGRIFQKGNAQDLSRVLEELVDDPEQRRRIAENATRWVVRERDWSVITDSVDQAYRSLISGATAR
jgi:glycosyltransferase involved in cell wall biosynthesis